MSINELTRHYNTCKSYSYLKNSQEILQEYPNYKGKNAASKKWKEKGDLRDEINYTIIPNGSMNEIPMEDMPTKNIIWNRLLASESLSALKEESLNSYEFAARKSNCH